MRVSREAWNLKEESFGPLLPYVQDEDITDINFNGTDVWVEHLKRGIYKAPVKLSKEFVNQLSIRVSNVVSEQINKYNNVLEAETDILRISIIHPSATNTGYAVSIRKTPAVMRLTEEKMLREKYCSSEVLEFLISCIHARMNIVFCGRPGAGKTELLKFLTQYIPKEEKVMTIEDTLEIHYKDINPGANCVELKVDDEFFPYTKAIKTALRQNPQWVLLSEARSVEVKYLLECFSTGLHGLTTLHTDDTRKIPDRIQNMMQDAYAASRLENDIYSFLNVGVLLRKKVTEAKEVVRFIDQICLFDRVEEQNIKHLLVEGGEFVSKEIPRNIQKKFHMGNKQIPPLNKKQADEGAWRRV
ncbi:MAG: ATPase, T2SS/T4P/T4SS family [Muricomes sp.]